MKIIVLSLGLTASMLSMTTLAAPAYPQGEEATSMVSKTSSQSSSEAAPLEVKHGGRTTSFTPEQEANIQKIVHDYLVQHPQVLMEAARALQVQQAEEVRAKAIRAIAQNKSQLFADAQAPVAGNAAGSVQIIEFFDYQCGHCKAMQPVMQKLVGQQANIKVIYKQLPIFGDHSEYAAKAALAAAKQNKFEVFHNALLSSKEALSSDKVLAIARSVGIDTQQLSRDMQDPAIQQELRDNFKLAESLSLMGTPSFVLANRSLTRFDFIPGATSQKDLEQRINKLSNKPVMVDGNPTSTQKSESANENVSGSSDTDEGSDTNTL